MTDVPAKLVSDFDEMKNPGDFYWAGDRMTFRCPCGCGDVGGIHVGGDRSVHPVWQWDGDREKPTVTPSIQFLSGCRWHGYLTGGVFKSV